MTIKSSLLLGRSKLNNSASVSTIKLEINKLKEDAHTGDHFLTPAQLEIVYRTNIRNGLEEELAKELFAQHGPNELKELPGQSYTKLFVHNMFGWFQCVLWVGALMNFLSYVVTVHVIGQDDLHANKNENLYLGIVIVCTVVFTGFFGFFQEAKNAHVMSSFLSLVPPDAVVIRDGAKKLIPVRNLVIGDIVEMIGGDIVPADVRILSCNNFCTNMASLTGETSAIKHTVYHTHDNPVESKNMAFFSCPITSGSARGLVVATGEMTQIGRIAGLVTGLKKEETPIAREITYFIKIICGLAFILGIFFFIIVFWVQKSWIAGLQHMLGIIIANVPEGLLVSLTVCLTISANVLKKKNCLAKNLQAVETLGSTSCICTDKTGTLTQNRMSVSHLIVNNTIIDKDDFTFVSEKSYNELCFAASLCLKSTFANNDPDTPIEERKIIGDASESAILRYMEVHRNATALRLKHPTVYQIPFSSEYKYHVTIHWMPEGYHYLLMKGAPEIVSEFCSTYATAEGEQPLKVADKIAFKQVFMKLANMGERVLGFCAKKLDPKEFVEGFHFDSQKGNFPLVDLHFIGLISLIDPPKKTIEKCLQECKNAGIRVMMVTGDHPVTALAISRKCGIIPNDLMTAYDYAFENNIDVSDVPLAVKKQMKAAIIIGDDLRFLSSDALRELIKKYQEVTFARTSPQQKLFIVETCQELGYIVAVTGDGVNDSPALRKADIGIAMGITGTEVSKQAADMILLDDDFGSIVQGVEEGRRIFDNLKKTIAYTLTSNTPEMMPYMMYMAFGLPLPLTIILIIIINVGTDLIPAFSLAYETSETDIMNIPPRKPNEHLVTPVLIFMAYYIVGMVQFLGGMYAYFVTMALDGFYPQKILYIRESWENQQKNVTDVFSNVWTYQDRKRIERRANTAYFASIVITQISDVIICKTRRISLIKKGMHNHLMHLGILVSLFVLGSVTYLPILNVVLGTEPIEFYLLFLGVPFALLMILADELRRYFIRSNKYKWLEEITYY